MRCLRVILAGVCTGAVVAVAWMVLNAVYPAGVGLEQVVTWGLGHYGQLICARAGGTRAIVWGTITATVAGESWRSFGEVFGATAGGFALVYVAAMAPQWQGPHFPGGLVAYLREQMGRSISKDRLSYTIPRRLALSQGR
jgi:hypothetical protein